ncbi:MAG TPA: alkaline phosphatase D family protein [Actinokineospora sp.]|nr:alkaline phosphatase D family protein [Actinokineospora sp.]
MSRFVINRRQALTGAAAVLGTALTAGVASAETADPFLLGVASGDPLPDRVVLWTRLVRDVYDAASMPSHPVPVQWQVAEDERFRRVVRSGTAFARPSLAHSVHVDACGLLPGRDYYYRFRAHGELSPVGRTRTAPAPHTDPARLRFAVASCQDFQNGYWPAYTAMAAEDLDLVLHLGDYIYEYDPASRFPDRLHVAPETPGLDQLRTLSDYRNRHAQYKGDPALRAAHAAFPWVVTWDDHEVENNYANLVDELDSGDSHQTPAAFAAQRAAAYQAYFEHMPIRAAYQPGSTDLRMYRGLDFGRLARMSVLDTRQHRTDQPGGLPSDFGPEFLGTGNTAGTLTGAEQERWLADGLTTSSARWNVVAQQVMLSRTRLPNFTPVPPVIVNLDQWDGYAPQRKRLLDLLVDNKVANPVFLAGDIHSTWVSELKRDFDDPASPSVAVEFVGTSISSDFPAAYDAPLKQTNPLFNPHVKYFDGLKRGYLRCEVDADQWRTDVRVVSGIDAPSAPISTAVSFAVESGTSKITVV